MEKEWATKIVELNDLVSEIDVLNHKVADLGENVLEEEQKED